LSRYPYNEGDFFETARDYVLSRSVRLSQAALDVEDAAQSEALMRLAEEHQAGLAAHLEEAGFQTILRQFQAVCPIWIRKYFRDPDPQY